MAKRKRKLTTKQNKAINLVTKHPEKTDAEISRDLMDLGVVNDRNYLTTTVSRNKQIRDIIAIKREKYQLRVVNQMPAALLVTKNALKSNNLKAAALVYKHALPVQEDQVVRQPMIQVETLNLIRGNQLQVLEERRDAIDITDSSDNKSN